MENLYRKSVFFKKKKCNKESDPVIVIISVKARKESVLLKSHSMYHLTREVSQWDKTKNSGIKPSAVFNSALWLMIISLQGHLINKVKAINMGL